MVIDLYTEELMSILRATSHLEVSGITDIEERYRVEAGSEKQDMVYSCVDDAVSRLEGRCLRYLKDKYVTYSDNVRDIPERYTFELAFSERRALGKSGPLKEAMSSFIVDYALSRFYSNVSQGDLAQKHALQAEGDAAMVEELLYTKQPPRV